MFVFFLPCFAVSQFVFSMKYWMLSLKLNEVQFQESRSLRTKIIIPAFMATGLVVILVAFVCSIINATSITTIVTLNASTLDQFSSTALKNLKNNWVISVILTTAISWASLFFLINAFNRIDKSVNGGL